MCVSKKKKTQDARALRRQGDDALLLRKWDEAIEALSKSILLEENNWLGFHKRASAHAGAGNLHKAVDDLERVLALKPDHHKSAVRRAELLTQLGRYTEAASALAAVPGKASDLCFCVCACLCVYRYTQDRSCLKHLFLSFLFSSFLILILFLSCLYFLFLKLITNLTLNY